MGTSGGLTFGGGRGVRKFLATYPTTRMENPGRGGGVQELHYVSIATSGSKKIGA